MYFHIQQYVSLMTPGDNGKDIITELLEEGLLRVEKNRRCSSKLVNNKLSACKQIVTMSM